MIKKCTKCGLLKPLEKYNREKATKDGRRSTCKKCESKRHKEYIKNNPEKYEAAKIRNNLKKRNVSLEHYNYMLDLQDHCCAICGVHESKLSKKLAVDHCHTFGTIRGLLCVNCNTAIGLLKENLDTLDKMKSYLSLYK